MRAGVQDNSGGERIASLVAEPGQVACVGCGNGGGGLDLGVVLVAVSGFGQPEDKRKAMEAGFDDHLTKPADTGDIENLLSRFPPRNSISSSVQ